MGDDGIGVRSVRYVEYRDDEGEPVDGAVIEEGLVRIHVNGSELATFMCTPRDLDELALGFLRAEGFIERPDDVRVLTVCPNRSCVDVWLHDLAFEAPSRRIVTSGCGGGITFDDMSGRYEPLNTDLWVTPGQITTLMQRLHEQAELYQAARGVHTSILSNGNEVLLVAEDVGRHNTIDRLWGKAMKHGISTEGCILLASGRISSEMLNKAARMRVPIVVSRTSPTSLSVDLATAWNITVIGYTRRDRFRVYTVPERVSSYSSTSMSRSINSSL